MKARVNTRAKKGEREGKRQRKDEGEGNMGRG